VSDEEAYKDIYEAVRGALRLICEDEVARLAPDLTIEEFWAVAEVIQARIGRGRPGENILARVGRQFDAAVAEACARKKGDELESMWKLAPKVPRP
jgi:hypothetical protein